MEENGESWKKLDWRIWIIILVGLSLFLFVFILVLLLFGKKTQQVPNSEITPSPSTQGQSSASQVPEPHIYKSPDYSVTVPSGWQEKSGAVNGGGTLLIINHPVTSDQPYSSLSVQVTSTASDSLARYEQIYTNLGYQKNIITVAGISAEKFTSTIGSPPNIRNSEVLLERNGAIYLIKFTEAVSANNQTQGRTLDAFLTSFQFTQ